MPPRHHPTALPVECLVALAEIAELADHDDAGLGPALLRARIVGDEIELGWRSLTPGVHPVDELLGTDAPPDWAALGVAAPGWAHQLDDGRRTRVRTAHLVGRDGAWASRWMPVSPDGDVGDVGDPDTPGVVGGAASGTADDARRPIGRVDDVCRRALGLPTAPPDVGTGALWAVQWLDDIVQRAAVGGDLAWPSVAVLHPAVPALRGGDERPPDRSGLIRLAGQLVAWRDWPVLRRACAAGTWTLDDLDPEIAAWLDDGAFARWVLGGYPDLDDLLAIVADLLPPDVADGVGATLHATGVTWR